MKTSLIILSLILSYSAFAMENQTSSTSEEKIESPSSGSKDQVKDQREIIKQEEESHEYPSSMGGAENVGAGMATGTGAGTRFGHDVEED